MYAEKSAFTAAHDKPVRSQDLPLNTGMPLLEQLRMVKTLFLTQLSRDMPCIGCAPVSHLSTQLVLSSLSHLSQSEVAVCKRLFLSRFNSSFKECAESNRDGRRLYSHSFITHSFLSSPFTAMDYDAYDALLHHIFKQVRLLPVLVSRR